VREIRPFIYKPAPARSILAGNPVPALTLLSGSSDLHPKKPFEPMQRREANLFSGHQTLSSTYIRKLVGKFFSAPPNVQFP